MADAVSRTDEPTDADNEETLDEVSRQIVEGYRRQPQTAEEEALALANAIRVIREEPW